jgi:hypothetical protein
MTNRKRDEREQKDAEMSIGGGFAIIGIDSASTCLSSWGDDPLAHTTDKWPRRLLPEDSHYLVHKVASIKIKDDVMRFTFVHEDGQEYHGPMYWGTMNGKKPVATRILRENGLIGTDEVHFVIASHSGIFPNGYPARLLREYPCKESDDLASMIRADNAAAAEEERQQMLWHLAEWTTEDQPDGGAMIDSWPPPLRSQDDRHDYRKWRTREFRQHLEGVARRAKNGEWYIIFSLHDHQEVDAKGGKPPKSKNTGSELPASVRAKRVTSRFVQFWFSGESFRIDLPNTVLTKAETAIIMRDRPAFFFANTHSKTDGRKAAVSRFNPLCREYTGGEEKTAADDMAFILFDIWKLPLDMRLDGRIGFAPRCFGISSGHRRNCTCVPKL